jgi:threonine aldolase
VSQPTVDLRSDTVTRPTAGMRKAMYEAEVGDDVYGEDPTVRALEQEAAALLGHEDAMYVPSGTMGNLVALRTCAQPGQEVLAELDAHIVSYELGGIAALAGIQSRTLPGERGILDPAVVRPQLRAFPGDEDYHLLRTAVLAVENTSVRGGGSIYPVERLVALREMTEAVGVAFHCDGARIWNAAVALGVPLSALGTQFDTLSVCLSKGLGAPVGSLVVTSGHRVAEARLWRKRLGGGMRQAGVIAAGGRYALHHHIERLAEDHARAQQLATGLAEAAPGSVDPALVETNIVLIRVPAAVDAVRRAAQQGVLLNAVAPDRLRAVLHLDVDDLGVARAVEVLAPILASTAARTPVEREPRLPLHRTNQPKRR